MIELTHDAGVAVLTMKRGKANALDGDFCDDLAAQFSALRHSDSKAVVITGQGRMFSAGVDLKQLADGGPDYARAFLPSLHKLYDAVFFHPKPVVAAINGHAIAGGCVLTACADRRIMARDAGRIGVTELLVGVPFPALAFEIVRFAIPARFLAEVTFSGATYDPDGALDRGWIDEIAEPEDLMEDALAVAQEMAELSPSAFALTKAQIRQPIIERMEKSGAATDKAVTELWCAADTHARIRDYVARTLNKMV